VSCTFQWHWLLHMRHFIIPHIGYTLWRSIALNAGTLSNPYLQLLIQSLVEGVFKACPFLPCGPHLRPSGLITSEVSLWFLYLLVCKKNKNNSSDLYLFAGIHWDLWCSIDKSKALWWHSDICIPWYLTRY
jgi:hypothetical protein